MSAIEFRNRVRAAIMHDRERLIETALSLRWIPPMRDTEGRGSAAGVTAEAIGLQVIELNALVRAYTQIAGHMDRVLAEMQGAAKPEEAKDAGEGIY